MTNESGIAEEFRFHSLDLIENPFEAYASLIEERPIYRDPGSGNYLVTRYEDLRQILRDPQTFPSNGLMNRVKARNGSDRYERMVQLYKTKGWLPERSLGGLDDPRHKQVRRIFDNAYRASRIRELEPHVKDTAYALISCFEREGACEFVSQFCVPFPLTIIGLQMGAPVEDLPMIKTWTEAFIRRGGAAQISEEEEAQLVEMDIEGQHYFKGIIDNLRKNPNDTVLSDLVNTQLDDGNLLSYNELFAHLMNDTFIGGSETTTNALAAGVLLLGRNPDQYAKLKNDPEKYMRTFVDEVIRLDSPVQTLYRTTSRDVTIQDVTIPEGSLIEVRYAAANRDPRHFACPADLDLERGNAGSHLGFGSGIHHCLGAPLARRELYWGFTALLERTKNLKLSAELNDFKHAHHIFLRSLNKLHIEFEFDGAA